MPVLLTVWDRYVHCATKIKVLGLHDFFCYCNDNLQYRIYYFTNTGFNYFGWASNAWKIRNKTPDPLFSVTSPILMSNDKEKKLYSHTLQVHSCLYATTPWREHCLVNKKKGKKKKEKWSNMSHQNCWQNNLCQVYGIDYFKFVNRHDWFILAVILNWIHI